MTLNPIFKEPASPQKTITQSPSSPPANPSTVQRKTRSDKTHDIRFPVTPDQKALIRRLARANDMKETQFTTKLLMTALSAYPVLPEYDYHDTKLYMHVKPKEIDYQKVFDLAVKYGISERQTVTRLIISILRQRWGSR
jgi:hypothetical protein